jgi:hypothetical protein
VATTYQKCDETVRELLGELLEQYRGDLQDAGATIELLFAFGSDGKPALKSRGQIVLGRCKINSLQDRAEGKADATIVLDGNRWPHWPEQRRLAVLHHELTHIDTWERGDGDRDDLGRPSLKIRYGDWDFDGFHQMIELYGAFSVESRNLKIIAETHQQLQLPFADMARAAAAEFGGTARVAADGLVEIRVPDGQPASTVGHNLGCGTISDPAPEPPKVDNDAWRAVPITEITGLPAEALEALQADGVATAGEWMERLNGHRQPDVEAYRKLSWKVTADAEGACDEHAQRLLPRCRICEWQAEEYYELKPGEVPESFVAGEVPALCRDCEPIKDGPPAVEAIAAAEVSDYSRPQVLRMKPLATPAKQLARLKGGREEYAGKLSGAEAAYRSQIATWPEPPEGEKRPNWIFQVTRSLENVANFKGCLQLLDEAIAQVQAEVDAAEAEKAAKKAAKKPSLKKAAAGATAVATAP